MGLITEKLEIIKKLTGIVDAALYGIHSGVTFGELSIIESRLSSYRLTGSYSNFHIKFGSSHANAFQFSLSEFPNCCGKGILHGINIKKEVNNENYRNKTLSEEEYKESIRLVLEIAQNLFTKGMYSSFDFIISDIDNPEIYRTIKKMGIKPTASWRNSRYPVGHNCNNYTISMVKTSDADYLDLSKAVVVG